jgi:hypothetical protein
MFMGLLSSSPDRTYAGPSRRIRRPGTLRGIATPEAGKRRLDTLVGKQQAQIFKVDRLDEMSIEAGLL